MTTRARPSTSTPPRQRDQPGHQGLDRRPSEEVFDYFDDRGKLLTRSECKPVGMQYGYAVTPYTIGQRLEESGIPRGLGRFIARMQFQAIATKAEKVAGVMTWFQEIAGRFYDEGLPFEWTNQVTGFKLVQDYVVTEERENHYAYLRDTGERKVYFRVPTRDHLPQNRRLKTINAIAANIVHSLDSGLLVLTKKRWSRPITIIHDSTGTHANHVRALRRHPGSPCRALHHHQPSRGHPRPGRGAARLQPARASPARRPGPREVMRTDYFWS